MEQQQYVPRCADWDVLQYSVPGGGSSALIGFLQTTNRLDRKKKKRCFLFSGLRYDPHLDCWCLGAVRFMSVWSVAAAEGEFGLFLLDALLESGRCQLQKSFSPGPSSVWQRLKLTHITPISKFNSLTRKNKKFWPLNRWLLYYHKSYKLFICPINDSH